MEVLVVEDSRMGEILTETIFALGHKARWVKSSEKAREILGRESFDFLLSDFNLPGENGLELATFVRDNFPGMLVTIMTGCLKNAVKARQEGFSVINKPFGIKALQEALKERPAAI